MLLDRGWSASSMCSSAGKVRHQKSPDLCLQDAEFDRDARFSEKPKSRTIVPWVWIDETNEDSSNPALNQRLRTRWRTSIKRTRFQGDEYREFRSVLYRWKRRHRRRF